MTALRFSDESPIQAVFFDLVGTLIRSRTSIGEQYADWARRFGAKRADPDRLGASFREAMRRAPAMAFPGRSLEDIATAEQGWWRQLVRGVIADAGVEGITEGDTFDRFFSALYHHFTTADAWEPYPDAAPALQRLQLRGIHVGLISNYDTRIFPVLDAVGLAPLLDSVTIPALVGAAKPEPAIFARALEPHAIAAARAVYVGDEVDDDYEGAEAAGMTAILIDRKRKHEGTGMRRVGSLLELVD